MEPGKSVLGRVMDDPRVRMLLERPSMRKDPFTVYVKLCEISIPRGGIFSDPLDKNFDYVVNPVIADCFGIKEDEFMSALYTLQGLGLVQWAEGGIIEIPAVRRTIQDQNKSVPMTSTERVRLFRERKKAREAIENRDKTKA